jgi:GAF domain-containing protein
VVAAPLVHESRLLGVVTIVSNVPGRTFQSRDAELLEVLATLAAAGLASLERARLDGALLAIRAAQHELNNQLSLTLGYCDMLVHDASLPEHLQPFAREAALGAQAAADALERLRQLARMDELPRSDTAFPSANPEI